MVNGFEIDGADPKSIRKARKAHANPTTLSLKKLLKKYQSQWDIFIDGWRRLTKENRDKGINTTRMDDFFEYITNWDYLKENFNELMHTGLLSRVHFEAVDYDLWDEKSKKMLESRDYHENFIGIGSGPPLGLFALIQLLDEYPQHRKLIKIDLFP